jgi:peptidoglycan/LPS O-acetylase OafA/YrhL
MSASTPNALHPDYRPDIDGLRAVAVLSVVLFHAYPQVIQGGYIGVDIFFVISGYLISTIIYGNLARGRFSIVDFYKRRVRRIFPALTLTLLATIGLGRLLLYPEEYQNLGAHLGAGAGFVSNLLQWRESGYFDEAAEFKPLLHLWSLGIEEQFYVIWPLLAWFTARRPASLPWVAAALWLLSMGLNLLITPTDSATAFYLPVTRFWELISGGLLAWVDLSPQRRLRSPLRRHPQLAAWAGALVLVIALATTTPGRAFPGWWALPPVLATVLLIGSGPDKGPVHRVLSSKFMVGIGLISYPLYLWHWPLLSYAAIAHGEMPSVGVRTAAVVLALLLAKATFEWVEKPLRQGAWPERVVPWLSGAMAVIGCFGILTSLGQDSPVSWAQRKWATLHDHAPRVAHKRHRSPDATIMLLGDSHAGHLDHGLRKLLGNTLADHTDAGCLPFDDVDRYDSRFPPGACARKMREALDLLLSRPAMDTVIMSTMGPVYLDNTTFRGTDPARVVGQEVLLLTRPELKDRWAIYETAMRSTLARLQAANKRVIFVLDVPELGINPRTCLPPRELTMFGLKLHLRGGEACSITRAEFDARAGRFQALIRRILADHPQVTLFDPTPLFCNETVCVGKQDDQLLYSDFDHLSDQGSDLVARELIKLVRPPP